MQYAKVNSGAREVPVIVVLPPRTMLLDLAGPLEVLRRANVEQSDLHFAVRYVGPNRSIVTSVGIRLEVELLPATLPDDAMVVVIGDVEKASEWAQTCDPVAEASDADAVVEWLRNLVRPSHLVIAICSGALLLARAGLLDGVACTTHHLDCAALAKLSPRARVLTNRLYVRDRNVYTSAGVTAGIDLMLHIMNGMIGPACTLEIARYLVVYLRRSGSDPQMSPWLQGRNHIHPVVHRVQDAIAKDPAQPWNRVQLSKFAGASGRHLSRLFQEHVGMTVTEYRNRLRVALARELISQSQLDMEHVAERAGFESTRQLRRAWGRIYDTSPRSARVPVDGTA